MRTTIDLPDPLFRELKAVAARRGESMKSVIRAAVEREIRGAAARPRGRIKFPILSSKEPGCLDLTNVDIDRLLT
jgi:Ribbon-helix-helix protein, copG family